MTDDQHDRNDGVDDGEFDTQERSALKAEHPGEPMWIPGNGNRDDRNDPSREGSDAGGDDGGKGNVLRLLGDDQIGESGEDEFVPRGEDVGPHEAGDGLATLHLEEDREAMADRGKQKRTPIVKGRGIIPVIPDHPLGDARIGEDRPSDIEGDDRFEHVQDDDHDADFLT